MTGKHSPRGLWIVVALALLWGVGSLSPAWADEANVKDDGSGIFSPPRGGPHGGSGGGAGGEADPDWWQTDVWAGAHVDALPASDSPRRTETRWTVRVLEDPVSEFVSWLLRISSHRLGF